MIASSHLYCRTQHIQLRKPGGRVCPWFGCLRGSRRDSLSFRKPTTRISIHWCDGWRGVGRTRGRHSLARLTNSP